MLCVERARRAWGRAVPQRCGDWREQRVGSRRRARRILRLLGRLLTAEDFPPAVVQRMTQLADEAVAFAGPPGWRRFRYRLTGRQADILIEGPGHNLIRLALTPEGYAEWQRWVMPGGEPRLVECRLIH